MQTAAQPLTQVTLTALDGLLLLIVLVSMILAFQRGIIRVLFSLCGLVAGILLAAWNYVSFATFLHRWVISLEASEVLAFLAILIGVMVLASVVGGLLRRAVKTVGLGFLDRLLGAVFGLFRGVLLGVGLMIALAAFVPDSPWLKNSSLAPYFLAGAHAVSFVVPDQLEVRIARGAAQLLHQDPDAHRLNTTPNHL